MRDVNKHDNEFTTNQGFQWKLFELLARCQPGLLPKKAEQVCGFGYIPYRTDCIASASRLASERFWLKCCLLASDLSRKLAVHQTSGGPYLYGDDQSKSEHVNSIIDHRASHLYSWSFYDGKRYVSLNLHHSSRNRCCTNCFYLFSRQHWRQV